MAFGPTLLSACAWAINFDQFTGGTPVEAGGAAPVGLPQDADAEILVDAAPDVSDFCRGATFCDEFERTSLSGAWDSLDGAVEGGMVELSIQDRGGNRTTGGYLRAVVPSGRVAGGVLTKAFGPAKTVRVSFALRVPSATIAREVDIGVLNWDLGVQGSASIFLRLYRGDGGTGLDFVGQHVDHDGGVLTVPVFSAVMPSGVWIAAAVDVLQANHPPQLTILVNGSPFATVSLNVVDLAGQSPIVNVGCVYASADDGGTTPYTFELDDVRVDLLPE